MNAKRINGKYGKSLVYETPGNKLLGNFLNKRC
jgi:hypothetical protein